MVSKLISSAHHTKLKNPEIVNTIFTNDLILDKNFLKKDVGPYVVTNSKEDFKTEGGGQLINEIIDSNKADLDENKLYELELKSIFERRFINALNNPNIDEDELLSQAYELKLHLMINYYVTSEWLSGLYIRFLTKEVVIINLFNLLATLDESLISSSLVIMIAFSVCVKNVKIKNNALEILESLILQRRLDAYNLVKEMEVIKPLWLEDYRQSILSENECL